MPTAVAQIEEKGFFLWEAMEQELKALAVHH